HVRAVGSHGPERCLMTAIRNRFLFGSSATDNDSSGFSDSPFLISALEGGAKGLSLASQLLSEAWYITITVEPVARAISVRAAIASICPMYSDSAPSMSFRLSTTMTSG